MSKTVLIVAKGAVATIIQNALRDTGWSLVCTASGSDALAQLQAGKFDLLICNEVLSDISSIELMRKVRSGSNETRTPALVVLTSATQDQIVRHLAAGFNDTLLKPFSTDILLEKIRALVG